MVDAQRIARAVVAQALSDAGIGMHSGERVGLSQAERSAARSFLLAQSGSWLKAREFWCSLADLDAGQLRTRTLTSLDAPPPTKQPPEPKPKRQPAPIRPEMMRKQKAPTPGTKLSSVLYYLKRPEGVSLDELMRALQWTRQSAQTGIQDLRLYGIVSKRGDDGRYRIVSLP